MKLCHAILIFLLLVAVSAKALAAPLVLLDERALSSSKASLTAGTASAAAREAYSRLLARADKSLGLNNPSVMDKTSLPPSGDKHDYLSLSRYWWPDPDKEDGLPWIRNDGITNPDTQTGKVDRGRFGKMTNAVNALALAYYFSDNEAYAEKAAAILETWFLNHKTRMNPHLKFAQSVPGNPSIRPTGILDGRLISVSILDGVALLSRSPHWSSDNNSKFNLWLSQYLDWLRHSPTGKLGALQDNNHGSWYRFQVAALGWYLDDTALVEKVIEDARRSLDDQLDSSGGQTHELARTRPFFYSCFNLEALTGIAIIGEKAGAKAGEIVDTSFWQYQSSRGKSLFLAIDYLMPVVVGEAWPHPAKNIDLAELAPVLGRIPERLRTVEHSNALQRILTNLAKTKEKSRQAQSVLDEHALLKQVRF